MSTQPANAIPAKDVLLLLQTVSEESGYAKALLRLALPVLQALPEQAELAVAIEEFIWMDDDDEDGGELVVERI